jgi:hypothetical protein
VFWKSTEVCGRMLLRDFQLGSREKPDLLHVLQSIIALRYSVVLVFLGSNGYLVVLSERRHLTMSSPKCRPTYVASDFGLARLGNSKCHMAEKSNSQIESVDADVENCLAES